MRIKHAIALRLDKSDSKMKNILQRVNNEVFHQDLKYKKYKFGRDNPDKTFYVIRPTSEAEGLLSLFFMVMRNIAFAEENNMIPIVDFQNYRTQYNCDRLINSSMNAWEYFFKPISTISLEEVYKSKNVYLAGWGRPEIKSNLFRNDYSEELNAKRHTFIQSHTCIQNNIRERVDSFHNSNFDGSVLGVYVRGTDYLKLKPKGHPIQPELEDVMKKVDEFIERHSIQKIFLVSEDFGIYQKFINRYGEMVFSSDNHYISDYKNDLVYSCLKDQDPFEKGAVYLEKMLLLARCPFIVTTLTNGSLFSLAVAERDFTEKYVFDLGKY